MRKLLKCMITQYKLIHKTQRLTIIKVNTYLYNLECSLNSLERYEEAIQMDDLAIELNP